MAKNELLLGAMELFTWEGADIDAAERAFAGTRGDFRAKLTAALQAVTVAQLKPERFIEIPASPESLSKAELSALVLAVRSGWPCSGTGCLQGHG